MWAVPGEQRMGRLRVTVSLGPIARRIAAAKWSEPDSAGGEAVFAGREAAVATNVADEPNPVSPPPGLCSLDVHIHDDDSGHPVPYLDVRADLSRNGDAVLSGFEMVPAARPAKGVAGLHYGNNIALEESGRYRIVVIIAASPLTGADGDTHCELTLDFDDGQTIR